MSILRELRKRARQITLPVLGACVAGYFVYHGVQGDRGIIAWLVLNQQIRDANAAQDELAAERATLERRVALLKPDSLDPDLLEERARVMLNLAHADELVIPLGPAPVAAPNPASPPAQPAAAP
jgi:cell division protein FtsB